MTPTKCKAKNQRGKGSNYKFSSANLAKKIIPVHTKRHRILEESKKDLTEKNIGIIVKKPLEMTVELILMKSFRAAPIGTTPKKIG